MKYPNKKVDRSNTPVGKYLIQLVANILVIFNEYFSENLGDLTSDNNKNEKKRRWNKNIKYSIILYSFFLCLTAAVTFILLLFTSAHARLLLHCHERSHSFIFTCFIYSSTLTLHPYPFTAPIVIPLIRYFWKKGYITIIGRTPITAIAIFTVVLGKLAPASPS